MPTSPYVARLRALVGPELLQLAAVGVLPRDPSGRVLLVRHADSGLWGTVGGAIELDETPLDAAVREAVEEIGLRPLDPALIGAFGGPEYRVEYANGDQVSYVVIAYACSLVGDPVPDGTEVTDARWIDEAQLPSLACNGLAAALLRDCGVTPGDVGPGGTAGRPLSP